MMTKNSCMPSIFHLLLPQVTRGRMRTMLWSFSRISKTRACSRETRLVCTTMWAPNNFLSLRFPTKFRSLLTCSSLMCNLRRKGPTWIWNSATTQSHLNKIRKCAGFATAAISRESASQGLRRYSSNRSVSARVVSSMCMRAV